MITLDKPLSAFDIRILFKCEEQDNAARNKSTTIFSVESFIWGKSREEGSVVILSLIIKLSLINNDD
jgi:hypothetical protein